MTRNGKKIVGKSEETEKSPIPNYLGYIMIFISSNMEIPNYLDNPNILLSLDMDFPNIFLIIYLMDIPEDIILLRLLFYILILYILNIFLIIYSYYYVISLIQIYM